MSVLHVKVETLLMEETQNLHVLVGAEADWINHIMARAAARLVLGAQVDVERSLVIEDELESHSVVLHDRVHHGVAAIAIDHVDLSAELDQADQVVAQHFILGVEPH